MSSDHKNCSDQDVLTPEKSTTVPVPCIYRRLVSVTLCGHKYRNAAQGDTDMACLTLSRFSGPHGVCLANSKCTRVAQFGPRHAQTVEKPLVPSVHVCEMGEIYTLV